MQQSILILNIFFIVQRQVIMAGSDGDTNKLAYCSRAFVLLLHVLWHSLVFARLKCPHYKINFKIRINNTTPGFGHYEALNNWKEKMHLCYMHYCNVLWLMVVYSLLCCVKIAKLQTSYCCFKTFQLVAQYHLAL